jgi:D-alanyl-D-alanine carboxypeptidase/D-alanyl-D-alanine-endopeptidase (penicillin-binding protein 4)
VLAPVLGGDCFQTEWLIQDWGQDWMPVSSDLVIDRNVVSGRDLSMGYPLATVSARSQSDALMRSLLMSQWAPEWVTYNKTDNSVDVYKPVNPPIGGILVANPCDYNIAYMRTMLKSMGVKIDGHDSSAGNETVVLAEHYSKPLANLIRFTLKESDNLYAQQFLRTVGVLPPINRSVEKATLEERGLARETAWLSGIGVVPAEVVLYDGCGLSRKNAITPHALNMVLRHMAGGKGNGPFVDLMIHEGPAKSFRYKTGAMDSVRSLSGVVMTSYGEPLAVTAIINAHTPLVRELKASLNSLIDKLQALGPLAFDTAPELLAKPKPKGKPKGKPPAKPNKSSVRRGLRSYHGR